MAPENAVEEEEKLRQQREQENIKALQVCPGTQQPALHNGCIRASSFVSIQRTFRRKSSMCLDRILGVGRPHSMERTLF